MTSLLLPSGGDLFAQNVKIGYCTTEVRTPGLKAQITGSHSYHAAVELRPELLNKFAGDKIDSVEFAISPKRGRRAEVFVCTDLDNISQTSLGAGTLDTAYHAGWNKVKLNTPVTISSGQTLYIGYILYLDDGEDYDCLLFDQSPYGGNSGINWYGYDLNWFNNTAGINRNLCIRAIASGQNIPNNDITLISIGNADGGEYVRQNQPTDFTAYVRNNGAQPVTSLNINIEAKGQTTDVVCDGFSIPNNEPFAVTLHGLTIPVEGNFNGVFTASKVNGADDPYPTDNSATRYGYSIKEGAEPVHHNVLFEEFTAEGNRGSFDADTLYRGAIGLSQQQGVIWVKHHTTYHNIADQFSLGGDGDYTALFGTSEEFTPAVCVDRHRFTGFDEPGPAYYSPYQEVTALLIQQVGNIYSFVSLSPTATVAADGSTLNVTVDGHASVNEMPLQDSLRLTTWLVEDSIVSTSQAGQTSFVQNGVLRRVLTDDIWGDSVSISGYDFSKAYTTTLDPSWNQSHLKVVTFLSNYNAGDVTDRAIYNTAAVPVSNPSGISTAVVSNGDMRITGIYDLSGRKVETLSPSNGIYIVKYSDGNSVMTKKVVGGKLQ